MPITTSDNCLLADKNDAELLQLHTEGNKDACHALITRHRDRMWSVAAQYAGPNDTDDALQNAFIRACDTAGSFRGQSAVTTWLHRITVNAAIDITRRRPRAVNMPEVPEQEGQHDAHRQVMRRIDIDKYWLQLSADYRAAILLVDMMGYPVKEAAELVGVGENTMKTRVARARRRLADKMRHLVIPLS